MPAPSRFQSESARRLAIAAIMIGLLAGATGTAILFAKARAPRGPVELVTETFDWLIIPRPANWQFQRVVNENETDDQQGLEPLAIFADPASDGQRITLYELSSPQPVGPEVAMHFTYQALPTATSQLREPIRLGGMIGMIGRGRLLGPRRQVWEQLTLVVTLDGRRHVVLNMLSPPRRALADAQLLTRMAEGLVDRRYVAVASPLRFSSADTSMPMPGGLRAYRLAEEPSAEEVLITPESGAKWWTVRMTPFALSGMENLRDLLAGLSDGRETFEPLPPGFRDLLAGNMNPTATERMLTVLIWRYWQTLGALPPRGAWTNFRSYKGHEAYALAIRSSRRGNTYRVAWTLRLDEDHAMLLELTASPEAAGQVQMAAQVLGTALTQSLQPSE